jgi:hypothetical protein
VGSSTIPHTNTSNDESDNLILRVAAMCSELMSRIDGCVAETDGSPNFQQLKVPGSGAVSGCGLTFSPTGQWFRQHAHPDKGAFLYTARQTFARWPLAGHRQQCYGLRLHALRVIVDRLDVALKVVDPWSRARGAQNRNRKNLWTPSALNHIWIRPRSRSISSSCAD